MLTGAAVGALVSVCGVLTAVAGATLVGAPGWLAAACGVVAVWPGMIVWARLARALLVRRTVADAAPWHAGRLLGMALRGIPVTRRDFNVPRRRRRARRLLAATLTMGTVEQDERWADRLERIAVEPAQLTQTRTIVVRAVVAGVALTFLGAALQWTPVGVVGSAIFALAVAAHTAAEHAAWLCEDLVAVAVLDDVVDT